MLRRLFQIVIVIAVIAAAAWALWPRPVPVETAVVGSRDIEITVEEDGKSRIRDVFSVSAPISGQMMRLNLLPGDAVTAQETVVATIRPAAPSLLDARTRRVAEAAVEAARAAVDLAGAELRQAEAQLNFLQGELTRASALVRRGTISERAFEKAKLDVETAMATVESANAALMVRRRELESAEANLLQGTEGGATDDCCVTVKAPVSGQVLRVLTESEQVVQAGMPLVEIGNPADLEIVAEVWSRDAVRMAPGAPATIEGWGGTPLRATVFRIDPSAVTKISALGIEEQRVSVVLRLEEDAARWTRLGHDFRVVARISLWRGTNLLAVPIGALFRQAGGWAVFVAEEGTARLRTIELGERNTDHAEVKQGLAAGDRVILHPSDVIADGTRILVEPAD
ncbi:MAG: HlyD family efflux transporter periplasmic adaptor subunit [Pararhodobacter sp.]|nr:HlyD family efflux transporter periplasmic adaptor subunit [Pararhodobacter sp.]